MNELSEVERTEALLWEAVRAFYGPGRRSQAKAAARAVEALSAYRAAVAAQALAPSPPWMAMTA